jgi:hypothetical protein
MRFGGYVGVVFNPKEIGRSAFIDIFLLLSVEIYSRGKALFMGFRYGIHAGCIITTHLQMSGSQRGSAVSISADQHIYRFKSGFEIGSNGHYKNQEGIFFCCPDSYLGTGSDKKWPDIQGRTGAIGRYIVFVQEDYLLNGFHEKFHRNLSQQYALGRLDHTHGIFLVPEESDTAILAGKGFETFEGLLSVMQTGGAYVYGKVLVRGDFQFTPFAIFKDTPDIVVSFHYFETQVFPVQIHILAVRGLCERSKVINPCFSHNNEMML